MSQSHKCGQQFLNTAGHIFTIIIPLFLAVLLLLSVLLYAFRGQIRVIVNNDLPEDIYVMRIEEKDLQERIPGKESAVFTYKITKSASINLQLKLGDEIMNTEIVGYCEPSYRGRVIVTIYNDNGKICVKVKSNVSF